MKPKYILFYIFFFVVFSLKSQNKTENIDLYNQTHIKFENDNSSANLIIGHPNISFDKIYEINKELLLAYDNSLSTFYLINLENNLILSSLSLFDLEEITIKKFESELDYSFNFLLTKINIVKNNFFNINYNHYPFIKLNDSTFFIGFLKNNETKFNEGIQFNIKITNKKLKEDFVKYEKNIFNDLKIENNNILKKNFFDYATIFKFNKENYCYFKTILVLYKNKNLKASEFNDIVMNIDDEQNIKHVLSLNKISNSSSLHFEDYNDFLISCNSFIYNSNDSITIYDTNFLFVKSIPLNKFIAKKNGVYKPYLKLLKDSYLNKLFLIEEFQNHTNSYFYNVFVFDNIFENNNELIKVNTFCSNQKLDIKQIFDNKLLYIKNNPLYNTNYIYSVNLQNNNTVNKDTVFLNFINYRKISTFKYNNLLDYLNNSKYLYLPFPKAIKKQFSNEKKIIKERLSQNSLQELAISIEKCIVSKDFKYLITNLSVIENYENNVLSLLIENNILNEDANCIITDYISILTKDLSYFKNIEKYLFDNYNNISVIKTPSNHFYKFIKIKEKWYLHSTVLIEGDDDTEVSRINFAKKYTLLKYKKSENTIKLKTEDNESIVIREISLLPENLNNRFFPKISYNASVYPQFTQQDLISSIKKAALNRNINYIFSQLMIYPIEVISEMEIDKQFINIIDTSIKHSEFFNKIMTDVKIVKINKNTYKTTAIFDNYHIQTYFVLFQKRWFLYYSLTIKTNE